MDVMDFWRIVLYLATDHRGFELKEKIKAWLIEWNYSFEDLGAFIKNPSDDYPDFVRLAGQAVAKDPEHNRAIILGATGQGEAMVANRFEGVRAIVYYGGPEEIVQLGREHNDSNVLSIGAAPGSTIEHGKAISEELVQKVVRLWLETPFSGDERHVRRIKKIDIQG